jgi:hypothetical protein
MTHDELIKYGINWLQRQRGYKYTSPIIISELVTGALEIPDILGFSQSHSVLIECKVSHADFIADSKKKHRQQVNGHGLGTYRFYLCPTGLIDISEIHDDWGLLYCSEVGYKNFRQITIIKEPTQHSYDETRIEEYYVLYSLLRRSKQHYFLKE